MNGKVSLGPIFVGGAMPLGRILELPDGSARVEAWDPASRSWVPGALDVAALLGMPPASPELLASLGAN